MNSTPLTPVAAPRFRWRSWSAILLGLLVGVLRLGAQSVTPDKTSYEIGEAIVVTFAGGPANAKDWIGVYKEGETPGGPSATIWNYVDGTQTGSAGLADGTVTFASGLAAAGNYVIYFLLNDGYDVLATASLTVTGPVDPPPTAVVATAHAAYFPGETFAVSFKGGPGNPADWIGIYPEGAVPGGPASTLWFYVNGSRTAGDGLSEGTVTFDGGLNLGGTWVAYLLENDGYTILAQTTFSVVDPTTTLVRVGQRTYAPGQAISVDFFNGWGNAKDWVAIYNEGETPGGPPSTLWAYVDGTQSGDTPLVQGTVTFAGGLAAPGNYVAYFLLNDGYDVLAMEAFTVAEATAEPPRILSVRPGNNAAGQPPIVAYAASITNGASKVVLTSVKLELDAAVVGANVTSANDLITVEFTNPALFAPGSTHTYRLTFADDAVPANLFTNEVTITVAEYRNLALPAPIYFENFDAVPEGQLPAGWTEKSYPMPLNPEVDFGDLGSAAYQTWTTVNADRFAGTFRTYGNPESSSSDYQRVNLPNPLNVLNGQVIMQGLGSGRFLFGNSGYQNGGASQVLYLYSPDFDLTGRTDVQVAFHSLWEQNQDSIAALEYSVDQGQTWLPVGYFLAAGDVLRDGEGNVDAVATFTAEYGDVARYFDDVLGVEVGGTYGAFIGAAVSQDLAPFIQARADDDPVGSKRIEVFPLPVAANQAKVRFRFAHAGTDSWYWGLDNFGLYSVPATGETPEVTVSRDGNVLTIAWTGGAGTVLQQASVLGDPDAWQPVPNSATSPATVTIGDGALFFRAIAP